MNLQHSELPASQDDQLGAVRRQLAFSWILMLLLVGLLLLPTLKLWIGYGVAGDPRPITPRGALAEFEQTTVDLFRETSPSVVFISTKTAYSDRFRRRVEEVEAGTGSGFVWDSDGHIVTNYHVLEGTSSAQVIFADQSTFAAKLVGVSPDNDLAVLRINAPAEYLRPVLIGASHDLAVGQSVYAIGNPFGLQQTLTTGVISAKSRTIQSPSSRTIEDVIQIDAAINPGNSGGPLLDSAGRLIGVNTAIYSPSGTSAGVGFSIPVDAVNRIVPAIISTGIYQPPQLGINVNEELSVAVARRTGIQGVVILEVLPGGPAAKAGLRGAESIKTRTSLEAMIPKLDIILKVNNRAVATIGDIQTVLQKFKSGDTVPILVYRDSKELMLEVVLD